MKYRPGEDINWMHNKGVELDGPQCKRKQGKHIHCWGKCFSVNELPISLQNTLVFNLPADATPI